MGGWPDFFIFGFGFGSGSWANDFFLPFISLRDDGLFSNRRAKKSAILTGFNGRISRQNAKDAKIAAANSHGFS